MMVCSNRTFIIIIIMVYCEHTALSSLYICVVSSSSHGLREEGGGEGLPCCDVGHTDKSRL